MRLAWRVRVVALALIAVWTTLRIDPPTVYHYWVLIGLLVAVGYLQVPLARVRGRHGRALQGIVILLEMAVLVYALVVPPPGSPPEWTMAMQFRLGNFGYVLIFIALTGLTYHPALAFWTAGAAVIAWLAASLIAVGEPGVFTILDLGRFQTMDATTLQATLLDPRYFSAVERAQEVLLAFVLAAIVALACSRARALVRREIQSSSERANLARYFSPDLVSKLATDTDLARTEARPDAAILFADIVGFTRFAESLPPEAVIRVLREFHGRMAKTVFSHGGTLHKFLGDGLMASFGATGLKGEDAASGSAAARSAGHALDCLIAIDATMAAWNADRIQEGAAPLRVAIGLHVGPVVTGDVGDERCLEFAVLGDTVNIASRLEGLCRPLDAAAVISRDVAAAALGHAALDAFVDVPGDTQLRGRDAPMALLILPLERVAVQGDRNAARRPAG